MIKRRDTAGGNDRQSKLIDQCGYCGKIRFRQSAVPLNIGINKAFDAYFSHGLCQFHGGKAGLFNPAARRYYSMTRIDADDNRVTIAAAGISDELGVFYRRRAENNAADADF